MQGPQALAGVWGRLPVAQSSRRALAAPTARFAPPPSGRFALRATAHRADAFLRCPKSLCRSTIGASVASGPKAARKRGMPQSAACPHAPAHPTPASVASGPKAARNAACRKARHAPHAPRTPCPQALRAAQRPQETRHAAKRGMPPRPSAPHPRKRCERPKGRKKRGMPQSAACPPRPPHPFPQALRAAQRPQETRHAAERGMPPHAPAPLLASVASGPKAARNAACRKAPLSSPNPRTPPQSPHPLNHIRKDGSISGTRILRLFRLHRHGRAGVRRGAVCAYPEGVGCKTA